MFSDDVATVPIPEMNASTRKRLASYGSQIDQIATKQKLAVHEVRHRILQDLAPPERQKLTGKLENFWMLDFTAFRDEVKKAFKTDIPIKDRDGWEKYLAEKSGEVKKLTADIEAAEREIDAIVYRLFDLTPGEIKLLEDSLEGQH